MMKLGKQQALLIVLVMMVVLLTACGFKLRGQIAALPFQSMYVNAPDGNSIGIQMERMIKSSSTTKLAPSPSEADATLDIISATNHRAILSLSGGGRVRDFNLIYRVIYRVLDKNGVEMVPNTEITLTRILPFLDAQIVAKENEEILLVRDMQNDALQQIIWRLSAYKAPVSESKQ